MAEKRADPKWSEILKEQKRRHASSEKWLAAKRKDSTVRNCATRQSRWMKALGKSMAFLWTYEMWMKAKEAWNNSCCYCGAKQSLEQDHFVPLSSPECPGTIPSNMVPACVSCSRSKGALMPQDWLSERQEVYARIVAHLSTVDSSS